MDNSNYLSTPEAYATPDQIKSARDYAKALLSGSGQQPVQHWSQGVSNMVSALVGGSLDYNAAQREKAGRSEAARDKASNIPSANFPGAPVGAAPFNENSPSSIRKVTGEVSNDPITNAATGIASVETGGSKNPYASLGPVIPKTGDRAYGKYQVMGANIPEWTQKHLGKAMTPEEFVANPAAQDAVFKGEFGGYQKKYGNDQDAASMWFTGKPYAQGAGRSDGYINGAEYVKRFNAGKPVAEGGVATPMALNGPDNVASVPAVRAMSAALRGDAPSAGAPPTQVAGPSMQMAAAKTPVQPIMPSAERVLPDPSAGNRPAINPALIKPQPGYTPDQLQRVMANPWISDAEKDAAYQTMLKRGQPFMMPSPTGSGQILVDPNNPSTQQFFADAPHWATKKVGVDSIENPIAQTIGPDGRVQTLGAPAAPVARPPIPGVSAPPLGINPYAPRSDAGAPPVAGGIPAAVAAEAAAAGGAPVAPQTAENAPAAPATPPNGAFPDVPVQVASTDPTAGISATVGKPTVAPAIPPGPQIAQAAANPLSKAMSLAPPGVSQEDFDTLQGMRKAKMDSEVGKQGQIDQLEIAKHGAINKQDLDKSLSEDSGKAAVKKYDTLSTQAQAARSLMPNMDLGLALMNDPNFHSGLASGVQDTWSRLKTAVLGDKYANAPNETFDKLAASTVLQTMKTTLAGLGQVRLAEINLLDKANANRYNTDASNRAVLEISKRGLQKIDQLDGMGQQYVSGDEVTNPVTGQVMLKANVGPDGELAPRHGLDAGFDKLARTFTLENPSFSKDEIKNYEQLFDSGRPPGEGKTNGPAKAAAAPPGGAPISGATPPPAAIEYLKANPGTRQMFEKRFGPADQYLGK